MARAGPRERSLGPPWRRLEPAKPPQAFASFYHCDELASWPVRGITRIRDNKSDPNIETGTFGLFSTCEELLRASVVRHRPEYLFFVTRPRGAGRVLAGYYRLGWLTEGPLHGRARDFVIAAREIRFIDPWPLDSLPTDLRLPLAAKWRLSTRLPTEQVRAIARLVDSRPDRTPDYLAEVTRMEAINRYHAGFSYPTWKRTGPWTWDDASLYLEGASPDATAEKVQNSSPTGRWLCSECSQEVANAALLKACPHCGKLGTLRPAPAAREAA